jgi:hypothetical protein
MTTITRRSLLGATAAAAAGTLTGCGAGHSRPRGRAAAQPALPSRRSAGKPIGDGSTADTGPQSGQPVTDRLEPGQTPPQFVIFSWDGAGEVGNGLFPRFRKLAADHGAKMTFFLSGLYCLPEAKKDLYRPPRNPVGASAIGYLADDHIKMTLEQVRGAWLEGHEIGTHFNGHFCDGPGSVANWTPTDWDSEVQQAVDFVTHWRTNTGFTDVAPLPFDYAKELVGARTPCLLGQQQWLPTARARGFRYDASNPGGLQTWPDKLQGIWNFPLQNIPFPGHTFEVLSMDYNILANQSHTATKSDPRNYAGWRSQATASYIAGFQRAYETNRAPFFIGNHFEEWNGGIYMDAVEEALKHIASVGGNDVRMVTFRQFAAWLDAQDPAILAKLRTLDVGKAPAAGWKALTAAA